MKLMIRNTMMMGMLVFTNHAFAAEKSTGDGTIHSGGLPDTLSERFINDFEFTGRLQTRYVWYGSSDIRDRPDRQEKLLRKVAASNIEGDDPYAAFSVRRLRLGIEGTINKKFLYELDLKVEQFVSPYETETHQVMVTDNGTPSTDTVTTIDETKGSVLDAYIQYQWKDTLNFTVGNTDVPFAREAMTPSYRLVSLERAEVTNEFGSRRDLGFQIGGEYKSGMLKYGLGIFNGGPDLSDGTNGAASLKDGSKNSSNLVSGRVEWNPLGNYESGRSMFADDLLLSFGLGAMYQNKRPYSIEPYRMDVDNYVSGTVDAGVNYKGWNLEGAFYYAMANYPDAMRFKDSTGKLREHIGHGYSGAYGQLSWFFIPRTHQAWVKYEFFQDGGFSKDNVSELLSATSTLIYDEISYGALSSPVDLSLTQYVSFGYNWYISRPHHVKIQWAYYMGLNYGADLDALAYVPLGLKDDWSAIQVQTMF